MSGIHKENKPLFVYKEISKNKIKTILLISSFVVIIILLSIGIGDAMGDINQGLIIGLVVTAVVVPLNLLCSKFFIMFSTRGTPIDINNPDHLRVKKLVEGLSISAGLKRVPDIYMLPTNIPNAFAGGLSPKSAYIGVTQGLVKMMDDLELEGVIAHEISHVVSYDVLVSTVAVSLFSVAIVLGDILRRMSMTSRGDSRRSKEDTGSVIMVAILMSFLLSIIIRLVGNLINLSISRKREYAADASAVRLCGYSSGLASALSKLSGNANKNNYDKEDIEELGGENLMGLYIFNPRKALINLFSTHPPIEDRIEKLQAMY